MRMPIRVAVASAVAALCIACSNETATQPSAAHAVPALAPTSLTIQNSSDKSIQRDVSMMDACDGPSFNAAVGPGDCT